jgi:heat shock protein HslJ
MQEVIDLVGDGRPREVRFPKVDVGPLAKQTPSDIVGDWKVIARYRKDGSMVDTVFSTLSFTDGGKFRGKASCNTYSGSFEVPATQRVDFSTIARTKMYCSDIAAEQAYFEVLEQLAYYYRVGESLILLSADLRPLVLAVGIVK